MAKEGTTVTGPCPCGSGHAYSECCEPLHDGEAVAESPGQLMRSRYCAFAVLQTDYLEETTDPQTRPQFDFAANRHWAEHAQFTKLEVISESEDGNKGQVEFKAYYNVEGKPHLHHERSKFRKQAGEWYYREGKILATGEL